MLRDSFGTILDGFNKRIMLGYLILLVEAIAISEGCVLCLKARISEACIQSENSSVVSWCIDIDREPL